MTISGAIYREGVAYSPDGAVYVAVASGSTIPSPTFTGTVTESSATVVSHQTTGVVRQLARWGVPVGLASSGSMANNGAVSGMTALPTTYSGGIWLYYPAGAVAAGIPAAPAFLWTVMSSTTAGTVYNSTWDGTGIPPLGTTTAFATTGPGAFTGVATGEIVAATVTIPAGALGPNGHLLAFFHAQHNTAAGNKILRIRHSTAAGTAHFAATVSTTAYMAGQAHIHNMGVAGVQKGFGLIGASGVAPLGTAAPGTYGTADTTAATTLVFTLEKATATNHVIWEGVVVNLVYGA